MKHPHAAALEKVYASFAQGDFKNMFAECAEGATFQIAGKSKIAGKYDRGTFASSLAPKFMEFSQGSFKLEVHDVIASDRHGVVMCSVHLMRDGKAVEYRTAHVWRFEGGKPVAGYEYLRDMYAFDAIWG